MRKILAIDDNRAIREMIEDYFSARKMKVKTLPDGSRAIETIIHFEPDLILLDINLPGKSGMELLNAFKKHPIAAQIPVIMLTVHKEAATQINGLVTGADDYVTKPCDPNILYARVISVLRRTLSQTREKCDQINLLHYLIDVNTRRGYKSYTKLLENYADSPDWWKCFVPDLIAQKGQKIRCYNFETTQSLQEEAFVERIKAMADILNYLQIEVLLNLIVRTKENEKIAAQIIAENDVPIDVKLIRRKCRTSAVAAGKT
jgi:CheY-like chemotaxis protein